MALNQAQPYFPSLDVYRENMQCFGWRHMTYFVLKGLNDKTLAVLPDTCISTDVTCINTGHTNVITSTDMKKIQLILAKQILNN